MIVATVRGFLLNFGVFPRPNGVALAVCLVTGFIHRHFRDGICDLMPSTEKDCLNCSMADKQFGIGNVYDKMGVKNMSYIGKWFVVDELRIAVGLSV